MLNQANLLNQQTFNTLKNQLNPASLAYALRILHRKKLLSATNDKTLYQDTKLTEIAKIVRILDENNILDKKNFQTILTYANQTMSAESGSTDKVSTLAQALEVFSQKLSLNQSNLNSIIKESNPLQFAEDTYMLHTAKRLAQEVKNKSENLRVLKNKFKLFNHCTDPTEVAAIIDILNKNNLLTIENLVLVNKQANLNDLQDALKTLAENKILDQEHFGEIIGKARPFQLAKILSILKKTDKLPPDLTKFVKEETPDGSIHFSALNILYKNRIFTAKNLTVLQKNEPYCYPYAELLVTLHKEITLDKDIYTAIDKMNDFDSPSVNSILKSLQEKNILTKDNFLKVIKYQNPIAIQKEINKLVSMKKLDESSFQRTMNHLHFLQKCQVYSYAPTPASSIKKILTNSSSHPQSPLTDSIQPESYSTKTPQKEAETSPSLKATQEAVAISTEASLADSNQTENDLTNSSQKETATSPSLKTPQESVTSPQGLAHASINDSHKREEEGLSLTLENKNKSETSRLSFSGDTMQDHLIKTPPQQGNTSSSYLAMFTIPLQWLVSPIQVIKSYSLQFFASLCKFTSLYTEGQSTLAIESSEDHKQQTLSLAPEDSDKDKNKPSDTTTQPHEAIIPNMSAQQKANTVEFISASTYSHNSSRYFNDENPRNKQNPEQSETSRHTSANKI